MSILIKASPRDEVPSKAGLAWLTANLLTEGTTTKTGPDISEEIDYLGASLGASVSADFTLFNYASLKKDLDAGLSIVSDIFMHPTFPEDELIRKKTVVKGLLQQRQDDPQYVAGKAFLREVFGSDHPYGRPTEGNETSLDAITRTDIIAFFSQSYRPDNTVIAIVGDVSAPDARILLERYFGAWSAMNRSALTQRKALSSPQLVEKKLLIDRDVTQASIVFGHVGISRNDPDYYAVQVMNYILGGGGFASRLMQVVRDKLGLAYSISSSFAAYECSGTFSVDVQTKNASVKTVIEEINRHIRLMRTELVSESELQDAKSYLSGSFPRRFETSKKLVDLIVTADFFGIGKNYVQNYLSSIERVTREDVLRVAQKYLHPDRAVLVIVGKKAEIESTNTQTNH
jgi:zinc protease